MEAIVNPHFDHGRVVWSDEYSGVYQPVAYDEQFDRQWELFLEKRAGFHHHAGVETKDRWIDERIADLTGEEGTIERRKFGARGYRLLRLLRGRFDAPDRGSGGRLQLEPKFPIDFFRGKRCLDVGCGAGRWTRTLLALGATVKSVDVSPSGLRSTRRFNPDVERLDLFEIASARSDLHRAFDFTICWGVLMCVHTPKLAFENVAATVKPGGHLYTMVYAPEGMHASPETLEQRRYYHRELRTIEERLDYALELAGGTNNAIGYLDLLNTFYNWVVPQAVLRGWYRRCEFEVPLLLNAGEPAKCAYHHLGRKRAE